MHGGLNEVLDPDFDQESWDDLFKNHCKLGQYREAWYTPNPYYTSYGGDSMGIPRWRALRNNKLARSKLSTLQIKQPLELKNVETRYVWKGKSLVSPRDNRRKRID